LTLINSVNISLVCNPEKVFIDLQQPRGTLCRANPGR
jgi:hypothetical protein